jgi:hypothetical protein
MAFVPHVPKGTIWLIWGEDKEHLHKEEYTGKRTERALQTKMVRTRKGSKGTYPQGAPDVNFVYLQYEAPNFPLSDITLVDLRSMGVLGKNILGEYATKGLSKTGGGWSANKYG